MFAAPSAAHACAPMMPGQMYQQHPNNFYGSVPPTTQTALASPNNHFTHSPYGAHVLGSAAAPTNFTIIGRKKSSSVSSADGSDNGNTVSSGRSDTNTPRQMHEFVGRFEQMSRTAHGCTQIQQVLNNESTEPEMYNGIVEELRPHFSELLFDRHASYVVKLILQKMDRADAVECIASLCSDWEWTAALATHSLHTRRIVQFFLDILNADESSFLIAMLCDAQYLVRLSLTEQGCITIQRILDIATRPDREAVFEVVRAHLFELSKHSHGNFVVQYLLRHGDVHRNSAAFVDVFGRRVIDVSCDKFASNVLEKSFQQITPEATGAIIDAIYASPQWQLQRLLADGVGNYIVQATIARCRADQLPAIHTQLAPLLPQVAYGAKIEAKITQRAQQLNRH